MYKSRLLHIIEYVAQNIQVQASGKSLWLECVI